jgi:hypothetical protein
MVIPADSTFDYVFDIDGDIRVSKTIGRVRGPLSKADRRLVGHALSSRVSTTSATRGSCMRD